MRTMGALLAQERAPSEIVGLYAAADARAGPQRPVHLRQRHEVEALSRRRARRDPRVTEATTAVAPESPARSSFKRIFVWGS